MVSSFMDALQGNGRVQEERGDVMSVIVKGMEIPVMCSYCKFREPFIDYAYCHLAEMDMGYEESDNCRHPDCPLIELPPHGRLINADKLKSRLVLDEDASELKKIRADILKWIDIQETVIEAEGSET